MLSRLTLALTLLVTAPAAAAGPTPPVPVSPATPDADNPACVGGDRQPGNGGADVAVNAAGDAVVTWTHDAGGGAQVVQAAVRPAGGSFGPPETIGGTLPCAVFGIAGHTPQAAIDGAGDVVVAFAATSGGNVVIRAAQRPAGGRFGTPADLSDDSRRADGAPRIAMNEAGLAAVVWSRNNGAKDVVQVAVKPPRGSFAPAVDLSNALQNARGPRVAVGEGGAIAAAWSRETAGTNSPTRAQATVRPAGAAAFVAGQDLSGTPAREAHVAVDGAGRVLATWLRTVAPADVAEAGTLTPQGVVTGTVDPISEPGEDPNSVDVAVTPGGEALASYVGCGPGPCVARAALRPDGGRFATPVTVSPPVNFDARVHGAMGRAGDAAVTVDNNFAGGRLLVAHRPAGGAFRDVAPLSPAGGDAFGGALAVDGEGNAVAAWTAAAGLTAPKAIQAAALDAAGPAITALGVPATAQAGVPVRLAAAARDRWTGAALIWDLGDGATATGAAVEHAFPPGTHAVTLTAADGAGNVARATRTIQVAAAPVAPEPEVIRSTVLTRWAFKGKRFALLSMRVARPPARAEVELRCRGGKCPFRSRTVTRRKRDKGQLAVVKTLSARRALDLRGRRFRAGQRIQVRITAPGAVGRVVTFKLKAGLEPRGRPSCLPPGARTPEACPQ